MAAVDDAILRAIYLEQEEHIVLINFAAIVALHQVVYCNLDFSQVIHLTARGQVMRVKSLLAIHFCVDPLLLHKLALKKSIVQLYLRQTLKITESGFSELTENSL